jgi:hypothetical protein
MTIFLNEILKELTPPILTNVEALLGKDTKVTKKTLKSLKTFAL